MKYFNTPTQIEFLDYENTKCYGIAYKDEIICGECGGVFSVDEIKITYKYEQWADITKSII